MFIFLIAQNFFWSPHKHELSQSQWLCTYDTFLFFLPFFITIHPTEKKSGGMQKVYCSLLELSSSDFKE